MKIETTTKKLYVLLSLLVIVVGVAFFFYSSHSIHESVSPFQLEVVKVGPSGYGYKILQNNKMFIYQPFVPALGHKQPFKSEEDAHRVGQLMMSRMEAGRDFSISRGDIHRLHLSGYQK